MDRAGTRARERRLMEECIVKRQDYVVDNTNSVASQRKVYIEAAKSAGFRVRGYLFPPDIKEALKRNAAREGKAKVPVPGIYRTLKYFQAPSFEEGFDELWEVRCQAGEFVVNQITD